MHRAFACALALGTMLAGAEPQSNPSWDTFASTVKKGKTLAVTLMDMRRVDGALVEIDRRSMTIAAGGARQTFAAADVFSVRYAGVRKRRAAWGVLAGAVAGGLVTRAIDSRSEHPNPTEAMVMGALFFGVPGGAIVGASLPTGPPLYEAPRVTRR